MAPRVRLSKGFTSSLSGAECPCTVDMAKNSMRPLLAHVSSLAIRLFDSGLRLYLLQVSLQTSLRLPNRSDERAR